LPLIYFYYRHLVYVCFVIVTSLRIVIDGNKETTYLYLDPYIQPIQTGGMTEIDAIK